MLLMIGLGVVCHLRIVDIDGLKWVYLGNNVSMVIRYGRILVGPCSIELCRDDEFVCGMGDEDGDIFWFVVDTKSGKIHKGSEFDVLCRKVGRELKVSEGNGSWVHSKLKTFLDYREVLRSR